MRIGINASFARKENTGLGQVTVNFLKKLLEKSDSLKKEGIEFFIYLEEDLNLSWPDNFYKRVFLPLWKRDDLLRKIIWEKYQLPRKVKKDECDIFFSLYQAPTIFRKNKKPFHLMLVHDLIWEIFPEYLNNARKKIYWKWIKRAIKKADKVVAISRHTEKDLIKHLGLNPSQITVSYLDVAAIYKKEISPELNRVTLKNYQLKPGYIYAGGGLEKRKNLDKLILAYKHLLEENKKSFFLEELPQLVISGKLMPELVPLIFDAETLIKKENLTQRVQLLDFVEQKYLPALYRNASVFVYPSLYEGFGLPVLEAMNQGVPVIASKSSSLPEVGQDGILYCDPSDEKELSRIIKKVLLNKPLRDTLSRRGKERANFFSWENFIAKFLNISRQEYAFRSKRKN